MKILLFGNLFIYYQGCQNLLFLKSSSSIKFEDLMLNVIMFKQFKQVTWTGFGKDFSKRLKSFSFDYSAISSGCCVSSLNCGSFLLVMYNGYDVTGRIIVFGFFVSIVQ